jgi:toxin YoeB
VSRGQGSRGSSRPEKRATIVQDECLEDLVHWISADRKVALRILDLMKAARRDPFGGIGKPEHLKHLGPDVWSRRITARDRLVYRVGDDFVDFLQARYHYGCAPTEHPRSFPVAKQASGGSASQGEGGGRKGDQGFGTTGAARRGRLRTAGPGGLHQ